MKQTEQRKQGPFALTLSALLALMLLSLAEKLGIFGPIPVTLLTACAFIACLLIFREKLFSHSDFEEKTPFASRAPFSQVALFDNANKLLFLSPGMQQLVQQAGIEVDSTLSLLTSLGKWSSEQATQLIHEARTKGQPLITPLLLDDHGTMLLVMQLNEPDGSDALLCEVFDISHCKHLGEIKEKMVDHVYMILRNDLMAITLSSDLLASDCEAEMKEQVLELLKDKVQIMDARLKECGELVKQDLYCYPAPSFPVSVDGPLQRALSLVKPMADSRAVTFDLKRARFLNLVFMEVNQFQTLLETLLTLLLESTEDNGCIHVQIKEVDKNCHFTLTSKKAHVTQAEFATSLHSNDALSKLLPHVQAWAGHLQIDETDTKELHCILVLRMLA